MFYFLHRYINKLKYYRYRIVKGERWVTKKILVVDDNPDLLDVVKIGLEQMKEGFQVTGVKDGEECINFLENNDHPDIILLDIMMPGIDGWELFTRIRDDERWNKIPIVFLTAKRDDFSKGFGRITAHDYITKPFAIDDLEKRIDEILDEEG